MTNSNESIRPFIRWAGGKQNLIEKISTFLPEKNKIKNYFEPFVGAGSLFFYSSFKKAFLSDINPNLINAYKYIRSHPVEIHERLSSYHDSLNQQINFYYDLRNTYNENIHVKNIDQAARFIFLVHTSFNGIYRVNRKGEYNVPIGKTNPNLPSLEHLIKASNKLKKSYIAVKSYTEILNKVSENDFVYLDPPYPALQGKSQFQQYTPLKFTDTDQIILSEFCNELRRRKCFVLISNAGIKGIWKLYDDWDIKVIKTYRYVSGKEQRSKVNEVIIKNY